MEFYWYGLLFWLGISVGSFLNMLLYRTEVRYKLRKKTDLAKKTKIRSDIGGRSFCDFCGKQLSWYENIPMFSWLMLRGRSRCCQKKLPYLYPLLELVMGILFALMSSQILNNNWWSFGLGLIIISFLMFSMVFDWRHMILPDFSTFILIGSGLLWWGVNGKLEISFLLSGIGASLFLLSLHLITKGKGMGMGDVKYVLFMGLFLGGAKTILAFYLAFIGGAVVGILMIVFFRKKKNSRMPFGPFLILATSVSWFWGDKLLLYFYRWF